MIPDRPPRAILHLRCGQRSVAVLVVPGSTRCDLRLVEDLLRLRLNAGRLGWSTELRELAPDLFELFALMGFAPGTCSTSGDRHCTDPSGPYS